MKNESFQVSCSVAYNPKIRQLKRMVGSAGCWSLVCLWAYTAAHKPDGVLSDMTARDVEIAAEWGGKKGKFYAALLACRLLDIDNGTPIIHEWHLHNPWQTTAQKREEKARKAALARWHSHTSNNAPSINHSTTTDNNRSVSRKSRPQAGSTMPVAMLKHDQMQYNSRAVNDLQRSSSDSLSELQAFSITNRDVLEHQHDSDFQQSSSLLPSDQKAPLNGHSPLPQALLNGQSSNPTSIAPCTAQASKTHDAYSRVEYANAEPPPTPPWTGGDGEGEQPYNLSTNSRESPESPSGSRFERDYSPVSSTDDVGNGDWERDAGFVSWLARLWNWEKASVCQYLRKAKRDAVTASDARGFYRDYLKERETGGSRGIDWEHHPNFAAYKARWDEDSYAFLLEFPAASPEGQLRYSFSSWMQERAKNQTSAPQVTQEDGFIPLQVSEDDYDF